MHPSHILQLQEPSTGEPPLQLSVRCKVQKSNSVTLGPMGREPLQVILVKGAGAGPRKPGALFIVFITFANIRLQTAPPEPR